MNLERVKSIVLIILLVTSSYLTWSIWTYEPTYEKIDEARYIKIQTDEKIVSDVIKPSQLLIHRYQRHFQTSNQEELTKAEEQMKKWNVSNVKLLSFSMTEKEFDHFVQENGTIDIQFSDEFPLSLYKMALNIQDKEVPDFSFNRIIYRQKDIQRQEGIVYFASSKQRSLVKASIDTSKLRAFNAIFYKKASSFPEYVKYSLNDHKQLFVSKNEVKMKEYKYYIGYLNINNLKMALFSDPLNTRHEYVASGEEYADSTSLMSLNTYTYMLSYINPSQKRETLSSASDLLTKSIQFINNHDGWQENNYRFVSMDETNQSVTFRLYQEGYPVFSTLGMSEIKETWGDKAVYTYQRPYFTFNFVFPTANQEVLLPSGLAVIEQLKEMPNFDDMNIEGVTIGYNISVAPSEKDLMLLEPTWYYCSGGNWFVVPFDESGGEINGLE